MKNRIKLGLILAAIILFFQNMYSQDTIIFKNGEKAIAVVSEIGTEVILYKNYFNPDGPNYKVNKREIISISYKNGLKEQFTEAKKMNFKKDNYIKEEQYSGINISNNNRYVSGGNVITTYEAWRQMSLKKDRKIDLHINKAKQANAMKHISGGVAIPLGIASLLFYEASVPETQFVNGSYVTVKTAKHDRNKMISIGLGVIATASLSTSIYMNFEKKNQTEKARKLYNKTYFNY